MSDIVPPKTGLLRLSVQIADLFLLSEGSVEWVKEPRVRLAWHVFFFSFSGLFFIDHFGANFIRSWLDTSDTATLAWRLFQTFSWAWLLIVLGVLAHYHYRYLLLTKKDLRLRNIVFFFLMAIFLFGFLYRDIYVLNPHLFNHSNPVIVPGKFSQALSFPTSYIFSYDFILYSACVATSIGYPRIDSASAIVSFINVVQVLSVMLIVGLLVATFVQHAKPD